ncbi:MAG TPA: nitroreductase family protein [Paenalcaligenes sp.]|nr:nitroreductase family protein [Paenalcaligenes sp.]
MKDTFLNALKRRRSQYALGPNVQLSPAEIQALVTETLRHTPSAFHSQSSRAILLFGQESERLWQLIEDHLRAIAPAENFAATEDKLRGFAAGAGTLLFFEDQQVVEALQKRYALYAEHFPVWSEHASGMAQLAVWTALANANIGASLQHYLPFADEAIKAQWDIPSHWQLRAQMPFGSIEGEPMEKTFIEDEERVKVFA